MRSRRLRGAAGTFGAAAVLLALGGAGCEAVPDLRFTTADARAEAPAGDGGVTDSSDAGTPPDAGDASSCTGPSPGGGAPCCGVAWCVGQCDQASCNECALKCQPGEVCCGKVGTVTCKAKCP